MKTTIEKINGHLCTVIRRPFCAEKVRECLAIGVPVVGEGSYGIVAIDWINAETNYVHFVHDLSPRGYESSPDDDKGDVHFDDFKSILTILPALPRNPKPEDAPLLYRYMAEGLYPAVEMYRGEIDDSVLCGWYSGNEWYTLDGANHSAPIITHAVDRGNNRVKVAIYG